MPYSCRRVDGRYIVFKQDPDGNWARLPSSGSHGSMKSCQRQLRALYAKEGIFRAENIVQINGVITDSAIIDRAKENSIIRINSGGGDLLEAINSANRIREKGFSTLVTGQAASAAALMAIAGKPARMMANTLLMIHNPRQALEGIYTAEQLREKADSIDRAIEIYKQEIQARTNSSKIDEWLSKDTWFTAEEALAVGLIDEVVPVYSRDRIAAQGFPDRIVAFLTEKELEEEKMSLLDVAEKFGIKVDDGAENDKIEEGIVAFFEEQTSQLSNLQKKLKDLEQKSKKDPDPEPKPQEFSDRIVAMATESREKDFKEILGEGKLAKAVTDDLQEIFCSKEMIVASLQDDYDGSFEKLMKALMKNEAIVSFGGKTGRQEDGTKKKSKDEEVPKLVQRLEAKKNKIRI